MPNIITAFMISLLVVLVISVVVLAVFALRLIISNRKALIADAQKILNGELVDEARKQQCIGGLSLFPDRESRELVCRLTSLSQ